MPLPSRTSRPVDRGHHIVTAKQLLRRIASASKIRLARLSSAVRRGNQSAFDIHFDGSFYLSSYPDVRVSNFHAADHYRSHGWREGRDPSPHFSTDFYLKAHPEVADGDIDPLTHWILSGCGEPVSAAELEAELTERLKRIVDPDAYLSTYPDVLSSGMDPFYHLISHGLEENRLSRAGFFSRELSFQGDPRRSSSDLDLVMSGEPLRSFEELRPLLDMQPTTNASRPVVEMGVVRYENPVSELARLLRSLEFNRAVRRVRILDNSTNPLDPATLPDAGSYETTYSHAMSNLGFARGHNKLMEAAFRSGADVYLGVNPDGFLLPRALDFALEEWIHWGDVGVMDLLTEPISHPKWYDPETGRTAWCSGVAFLIGRAGYEASGGFDPDFPMYGEDVDLSFRLRESGLSCRSSLRAYFHHDVTPRFSQRDDYRRPLALAGNWYLLRKWEQYTRAAELEQTIRTEFGPAALPAPPISTRRPSREIQDDFELDRFAHSRFF